MWKRLIYMCTIVANEMFSIKCKVFSLHFVPVFFVMCIFSVYFTACTENCTEILQLGGIVGDILWSCRTAKLSIMWEREREREEKSVVHIATFVAYQNVSRIYWRNSPRTNIDKQDFKWNYLFMSFLSRVLSTISTARPDINKQMWSSIWNASRQTNHQILFINFIQNYACQYNAITLLDM